VPPASVPDRPTHSLAKPGQHRSVQRAARRHRPCTKQTGRGEGSTGAHTGHAGFYVGPGPEPPPENQIGWGSVPVPDRPIIAPGTSGPMPGWSAFTLDCNRDPHQRRIPVGARWLYRAGRRRARRSRPLIPAQENCFESDLSSCELLAKCLAIMGGRI
jgi:hypothetical protein